MGCSTFFIDIIYSLIEKQEIGRINQIRTDYEELMRAHRREVDVSLTTKSPLSEQELEFYKNSIKLDYLTPKDNVIFNHAVDPSIIEGYLVNISGVTHDYTWNKAIEEQEKSEKDLKKQKKRNFYPKHLSFPLWIKKLSTKLSLSTNLCLLMLFPSFMLLNIKKNRKIYFI